MGASLLCPCLYTGPCDNLHFQNDLKGSMRSITILCGLVIVMVTIANHGTEARSPRAWLHGRADLADHGVATPPPPAPRADLADRCTFGLGIGLWPWPCLL